MSMVNLKIIFVKTPNSRPGRDIHYNRNGRKQTRISVALKQAPHLRGGGGGLISIRVNTVLSNVTMVLSTALK